MYCYTGTLKAGRYGSYSFTCILHHTWLYLVSIHQTALVADI